MMSSSAPPISALLTSIFTHNELSIATPDARDVCGACVVARGERVRERVCVIYSRGKPSTCV